PTHPTRRRDDNLELLGWLTTRIDQLDEHIARVAAVDPHARLLLTHPGAGPMTALTTVLVLGPIERFPDSKHVVSYVGLAPAINASADKQRLGKITKQGNPLLRWGLGQAAPRAAPAGDDPRPWDFWILPRPRPRQGGGRRARKLLVRFYVMLRDHIDYHEFRRRGHERRAAGERGSIAVAT